MTVFHILVFGLLFPALVLWGGSTNLINWGPGLLFAGAACVLMLDKDRLGLSSGLIHTGGFLALLALMLIRARYSEDVSAAANSSALIGFAAAGFLIGKLANEAKSRALFIGLSLAAMLNFYCSVVQINDSGWNLIYPQRSAELPSGLFAHYSYSAAFCLGAAGLLVSSGLKERAWLKAMLIGGAICALVTIPISLSRGGNLALAFMMAAAVSLLLARAFSHAKTVFSTWLPAITLFALILILAGSVVPLIGRNKGLGGFYADSVRIDFWEAATRISADHPWLGGGPGSFAWKIFQIKSGLTLEPGMVHNEALQLAVEYGYPALFLIAAMIAVPVALCLWRFVNKTDPASTAWAALGIVAMLIQSNFESIFHAGPGAFVAALILGQLSRHVWRMDNAGSSALEKTPSDVPFLSAARALVDDYLADDNGAASKLAGSLLQTKDKRWKQSAFDLIFWEKTRNEEALRRKVIDLGIGFTQELEKLSSATNPLAKNDPSSTGTPRWRIIGDVALAACSFTILMTGTRLSHSLANAWTPLYQPQELTIMKRLDQLLSVAENRSGLGIDRFVLAAARDCIHQFEKQEDRENWAAAYKTRILRAIPGWKTDPGAALQMAEIIGWTCDFQSAIGFYNHAIATQGDNESLFMAHSFKGQYLYELSLSAGAAGDKPQEEFFARQAIDCFKDASAALGIHHRALDPYFAKMLKHCEVYGTKDM
jgi:O-antigen ligase